MAITISTSHPFHCLCLTQEKDQCHQYQGESIDSACNFVCSNLNYCLKRSSLGPLSQPTALIKPTTMAVWNFLECEQILVLLRLWCTGTHAAVTRLKPLIIRAPSSPSPPSPSRRRQTVINPFSTRLDFSFASTHRISQLIHILW